MAELVPAPFADLVTRLYEEPTRQQSLFELPMRRWFNPDDGPATRVTFHGRPAASPIGPAAGPHTQMAHNLVLSYVAGCRILELKTVQINDALEIPFTPLGIPVGAQRAGALLCAVLDAQRSHVAHQGERLHHDVLSGVPDPGPRALGAFL